MGRHPLLEAAPPPKRRQPWEREPTARGLRSRAKPAAPHGYGGQGPFLSCGRCLETAIDTI